MTRHSPYSLLPSITISDVRLAMIPPDRVAGFQGVDLEPLRQKVRTCEP